MEKIICAAIWFQDGKKHEHQPRNIDSGFVVAGMRHHNCFMTYAIIKEIIKPDKLVTFDGTHPLQGFITTTGRFVDRKEGAEIAYAAKQIWEPKETLYSEDLY